MIVLTVEEEGRSFATEVRLEGGRFAVELGGQLRVAGFLDELEGGEEVRRAGFEAPPQLDLGPQTAGLAEDLLGYPLVIPEAGLCRLRLQLRGARFLRPEVKDAPRSTESARPGREPRRRPLVPNLEVLEQDWPELDQPQGRLAPGDYGVHAGAVAVVGAHAAIPVTVERGGIAARAAIALAGDQIDERRFLGLLHVSLSPCGAKLGWARGVGACRR